MIQSVFHLMFQKTSTTMSKLMFQKTLLNFFKYLESMLTWKCHVRIFGLPHQNLGAVHITIPSSPPKIIKIFKKLSWQLGPLHLSHFGDFRRPWLQVTSRKICRVVRDVQKNLDMLLTSKKTPHFGFHHRWHQTCSSRRHSMFFSTSPKSLFSYSDSLKEC